MSRARSITTRIVAPLVAVLLAAGACAAEPLAVDGSERGVSLGDDLPVWHDETGSVDLAGARQAFARGAFAALDGHGSTGLAPGAFWSRFALRNTTTEAIALRLEYIDHQLMSLRAYARAEGSDRFSTLVDVALDEPFSSRPVAHHRLVAPLTLAAGETVEVFVRYGSHEMGFVFPALRIWSPNALAETQARELALVTLMAGGLLVMALLSLVAGVAIRSPTFYAYSAHAAAKVAVWFTVLGFTNQLLVADGLHWRYLSITGALSLFTGLCFARIFLKTRRHLPRFDYLLLFLMGNSLFLALAAVVEQKTLAVLSITLALLLHPVVSVAGLMRWFQGSRDAALFTIAWTFLVIGLFAQALRDLGLVAHNLVNYYWPAVASYTEMVVILGAMGVRIRSLRREKENAEQERLLQLEESKERLGALVAERTRELEAVKIAAEREARTDTLTGISNRRSFIDDGQKMLERCREQGLSLNLVMMDLDHFKAINDHHGHDAGDKALVAFAEAVAGMVRERDLFGRLGGEEFALLSISQPDAAVRTAERVCSRVRSLSVDYGTVAVAFTLSVGVAHLDEETTIEALLKRADKALYDAKQGGRDRVAVAA
ncbi:MAG: diguanylate cyclase [Pseudomonadota bacterium]